MEEQDEKNAKLAAIRDEAMRRKEEIEFALNVDGFHFFLGFDDDIFLLDYWDANQGLNYLVGINYVEEYFDESPYLRIVTIECDFYLEKEQPHIVEAFKRRLGRLKKIWDSGGHPELNPPWYYIEWAISKNYEIPWLAYAIEKGFYKPKQPDSKIKENEISPSGREHVSNKLALLNQATQKYWANADRADRTTHPDNRDIAAWLIERGYSQSLAESAATIIRPEWAATGRKPEK